MIAEDRKERRRQTRLDVKLMRNLGIMRWGSIILGPEPMKVEPAKELTADEQKARIEEEQRRRHETMFGASSIRPKLPFEFTSMPTSKAGGR